MMQLMHGNYAKMAKYGQNVNSKYFTVTDKEDYPNVLPPLLEWEAGMENVKTAWITFTAIMIMEIVVYQL